MAISKHPMSALKGTQEGRDLMAQVRAHRGPSAPKPTTKGTPVAAKPFIKEAIKRPGALTAKAQAAGMSVDAFANAHKGDKGVTGDESRFYLNVLAKTPAGRKHLTDERDVAKQIVARNKKP